MILCIHRYIEFEKEMKALSQRHEEEASDWKQFQSDLQMAVVIANAIKAEAVEDKEVLMDKNKETTRKVSLVILVFLLLRHSYCLSILEATEGVDCTIRCYCLACYEISPYHECFVFIYIYETYATMYNNK